MSFKIELSETQYNKIIKFALSEEKKKTLLNEGASSMVMSDLKNKIQARMKGSLKIGPKLKNYPTAIDIIGYSNGRSLTFFDNGVVKWYDGKNFTKGGKWDYNMTKEGKLAGGWLKNDKGVNISLDDAINYPAKNYGTGAGPLVTKTTNTQSNNVCDKCKNDPDYYIKNLVTCRNCGLDEFINAQNYPDVWNDLGQKLNSYKPKTSTYFENKNAHVVEYLGSKPQDKKQLVFKKDGTIWFTDKPGSVKNNGAKWDKKSVKDNKLAGGWLTNNQGKKVSLGDALSEPEFNFGNLGSKLENPYLVNDSTSLYLQSNTEAKKWYNSLKTKCTLPDNPTASLFNGNNIFCLLRNNPPSKFIAYIIRDSKGIVIDDEARVEEAFLAIKTKSRYEQVKYYLGEDPYKYVANFMDTNIKYHKQAVFKTYSDITQGKVDSKEIKSELCPVAKFTPLKPSGTNSHNPNPRDLVKLINDEFFKNRDLNRVPADFGWKSNNNIYPFPKIYTKQEIQSCELKLKEKQNLNTQIYGKEMSDYLKNLPKNVTPNDINNSFKESNKSGDDADNLKTNVDNMKAFTYLLTEQSRLIPKYCKMPWIKRVTYYPKSNMNPVIKHKLRAEGFSESVTENIKINYADLCQDFGGLWVYGSMTSQYQCFCRDATHPALTLNNFKPKQKSGYDAVDLTTGEQTKISLFDDNIKRRNWSHDDSKILLLDIVKSLAAVFLPGMLALVISSGISLGLAVKYYNDGKYYLCGIEIVFAILSAVGKIPGIKDHIKNELMSALRALRRSETLSPKQMRALVYVLGYESLGSDAMKKELIKKYGEKAVKNYGLQQILLNFGKEMEKVFAKTLGVDKKGLSKMAQDI
jgi:hypothetical protein